MKTKAQLTRQRIMDAALNVFANKGFHRKVILLAKKFLKKNM